MSRQDTLDLMLNSIVETMKDLYSRAGTSAEDQKVYMEQGNESFKVIAISLYDKLLESGVLKDD
jgi:hypothetical protein